MKVKGKQSPRAGNNHAESDPPGKLKLIESLKTLIETKDFNSITTAEIAKCAGTNEALIYWHFQDKRGLLHYVLEEYLLDHMALIDSELKKTKRAVDKLKKMIRLSFDVWGKNKIYAKIILIEVRSFPGYFESRSYRIVAAYANLMKAIIQEGIESGEIRDDLPASVMRNSILGAIEHNVLPGVVFDKAISPKQRTDDLSKILFEGISKKSR